MTVAEETRPRTGVIGLGQMGRGIALNLMRSGLLEAVWDAAPVALEPFASEDHVRIARCPREVAADCDVVIFVVPSSKEVSECLDGPDGLLSVPSHSQIILDLTTSDPAATRKNIAQAYAHGRAYLDAGMSGGAQGADAAQLALMVGGRSDVFERCRPIFSAIADMDKVSHVGPEGAGHTMKLVHNMICHGIFMVTTEGCRIAERAGIDLAKAVDIINNGNARSFVSAQRFTRHILSETWDARSRVSNLEKDVKLGVSLAQELGAPSMYAQYTAALLSRACASGMADDDFSLLYKAFDRLAD